MGQSLAKGATRLGSCPSTRPQRRDDLELAIGSRGTPERAASEKAYLKSDLAFLGTTLGETRSAVKTFVKENTLDHEDLVSLVVALWDVPVFERRMAAVMLLDLHPKLLAAGDLPLLERLIRQSLTWALVDALAGDVVSAVRAADPSVESVMDRWATDPDFWIRRSSLLAELRPLRKGADLGPFLRRADLDARREGVLHPESHWLGPSRGRKAPA